MSAALLLLGGVVERLEAIAARSVHCCITSPPYWGLRDYGEAGQIGLEATPEEYVAKLVEVFAAVRRVLRDDGTVWLNLGDSYASTPPGNKTKGVSAASTLHGIRSDRYRTTLSQSVQTKRSTLAPGLKPGDLVGIPWRVAFALQADGWYLRRDIIWSKPNPMPESMSGWRWERHRVTIDEHERLRSLREAESGDEDGSGDLPEMPTREGVRSEASIPAEPQREGDDASARGTSGREREAPQVLSVEAGQKELRAVHENRQGQARGSGKDAAIPGEERGRSGEPERRAMDEDTRGPQASLLLLQEEGGDDHGSCDTALEGRGALAGERGTGLPELQLHEAGQALASGLVPCPGCPKCDPNDGLVLRRGSWRCTTAHEYIFQFAKSRDYFCDAEAVREANAINPNWNYGSENYRRDETQDAYKIGGDNKKRKAYPKGWSGLASAGPNGAGRNPRSVWNITTHPYADAHFATFPPELPERCIRAGTAEKNCGECGAPWAPVVERTSMEVRDSPKSAARREVSRTSPSGTMTKPPLSNVLGHRPTCLCNAANTVSATVLDPFSGAGTTGLVALRLNRDYIGIELKLEYVEMSEKRILDDAPLLNSVSIGTGGAPDGPFARSEAELVREDR